MNCPEPSSPQVQLPVPIVAGVQDSLLVAIHDLDRLQGLLTHATDNLMARFDAANAALARVGAAAGDAAALADARRTLGAAVTELQFDDMATQLIGHTARALAQAAQALGGAAIAGEDEDEDAMELLPPAVFRPNPVTQGEMDAGSIELF